MSGGPFRDQHTDNEKKSRRKPQMEELDDSSFDSQDDIPAEPRRSVRASSQHTPEDVVVQQPEQSERFSSSKWIIICLVVLIVGVIIGFNIPGIANTTESGGNDEIVSSLNTPIDSDKYQAVFLANGQFYFGKLHVVNQYYMKLTDVYYLQSNDKSKSKKSSSSDMQLVKLGNEIQGPEDSMVISRKQILYFENLRKDGKVSLSIDGYKSKSKDTKDTKDTKKSDTESDKK